MIFAFGVQSIDIENISRVCTKAVIATLEAYADFQNYLRKLRSDISRKGLRIYHSSVCILIKDYSQ